MATNQTKPTEQPPQTEQLLKAIAKTNGHPAPDEWVAEVMKNLKD